MNLLACGIDPWHEGGQGNVQRRSRVPLQERLDDADLARSIRTRERYVEHPIIACGVIESFGIDALFVGLVGRGEVDKFRPGAGWIRQVVKEGSCST